MAKIKIRDIEGDADEIKNLFKDLGCDLNSYISTTPIKTKVPTYWLFILGAAFFVLTCIIWCDLFNPPPVVCVLTNHTPHRQSPIAFHPWFVSSQTTLRIFTRQ